MVVYLHEALDRRLASGKPLKREDIEEAAIEGAVHRLRPKLMTVCVVLWSLIPILWETGGGSDVMKPIAAPIVGGIITSTIHVLILVPVFFALLMERALRRQTLQPRESHVGVSEPLGQWRIPTTSVDTQLHRARRSESWFQICLRRRKLTIALSTCHSHMSLFILALSVCNP